MELFQFKRDADKLERISKISSFEESWRTARVVKGTDHTCAVKRLSDLGLVNVVKRRKSAIQWLPAAV